MKTIYKYKKSNVGNILIMILLIIFTGIFIATTIYTIIVNPKERKEVGYLLK